VSRSCALLGGFAIGARVLVLALCLVIIVVIKFL